MSDPGCGDAWPAFLGPRRTDANGRVYCIGTAGSFILVCLQCGAERFRCKPGGYYVETCWGRGPDYDHDTPCRGQPMYPLDPVTLEKLRITWGQILGA